MFTLEHFIWLFISAGGIILIPLINKKFKISFDTNLTILIVVCTISELYKVFTNMDYHPSADIHGAYLNPEYLPLHLCSLQIFFAYALKFFIKKEKTRQKLLCFMFPTMFIGATLALIITTVGASFTDLEVYRYFIFHMYLIGFSVYLITNHIIVIKWKTLFENFIYLCAIALFGIYVNCLLSDKGVNFFYLSAPPMENLPLLNLNHGWHFYFLTLFGLAIIFMLVIHIPLIIINERKEKEILKQNQQICLTDK